MYCLYKRKVDEGRGQDVGGEGDGRAATWWAGGSDERCRTLTPAA